MRRWRYEDDDEEESGALRARRERVVKGGADGPEDVDAAFAQIVADLEREGLGSGVTADLDDPDDKPAAVAQDAEQDVADAPEESGDDDRHRGRKTGVLDEPDLPDLPEIAQPATSGWRGHETEMDWAWSSEDEHYVPPEPPPIPKPSPLTILALVLMLIALFLLVAPNVIGLATRVATPIALVSAAVGIGMVVLRIRQNNTPNDGDSDDNGAQV